MKYILITLMVILFSGCATWNGIKKDTNSGANWTKQKVNRGATYVKDKTQ